MAKKLTIAFLVLAITLSTSVAMACTSVVLPPGSTVEGFSSVTHSADSGSTPYEFFKVPAKNWQRGSMVDVLYIPQTTSGNQLHVVAGQPTGNKIPQVPHTYGYLTSSIFGYMNEQQVAIGETTIGGRRELSNTNGYFDITNLSMLALERGATAREAILVMGSLAEKYGYSDGGEELSVADPYEAWVFEIIGPGPLWQVGDDEPGAFWVAQRVPDGHVAASANHPVIDQINFNDPENFLFAPGIKEYAIAQGWWKADSKEPFSWRENFLAYASVETCGRRIWRVMTLCNPDLVGKIDEKDLPFSVPVKEKLTLADIMAIHADHYEGTEFDLTDGITAGPWSNPRRYRPSGFSYLGKSYGWQRGISQVQTEYVTITQSRRWLPDEVGGVVWYGPSNGDLTCYVPFYAGVNYVTEAMNSKAGSHQEFTRESFRWAVSTVNTFADLMYNSISKDIKVMIEKYTGRFMKEQPIIDLLAVELFKSSPKAAREYLTDYCNNNVISARDAWWALLDELFRKYDMTNVYVAETQKRVPGVWNEDFVRTMVKADPPGQPGEITNN
ncbi:MAG TPA: C69 family dipeptidase [Bacillota bacterium]|nr:C69 family dipeptidase [Bacillota bacterium]HOH10973.1 C69 family dipeptidase [Bacillota bacterium]